MCGRYKLSTKAPEILATFGATAADGYAPRASYNIAPTHEVACIRRDDGARHLLPMRWGLVPFWGKEPSIGARLINARVETVFEKPAFRDSLEERRCIVVSDGFYEWLPAGRTKQPYLICFDDRRVFGFAGLWSRWKGTIGGAPRVLETCTVLTSPPNDVAAKVHDRMPVIFDPHTDAALIEEWLDCSRTVDVSALRTPRPLPGLTAFPVDKRVGNVKYDEPSLAEPQPPTTLFP